MALRPGDQVLVTGSAGRVGRAVVAELQRAGLGVRGFDLSDGDDVQDHAAVAERMRGCAGVVHLAAVDEPSEEVPPLMPRTVGGAGRLMATNVGGTANVLAAAAAAGGDVSRVVLMSSVDVFGCFMGQGLPQYVPIDDAHPVAPVGPYAWSKLAGEELCAAFTRATGTASVCLRAPGVYDAEVTATVLAERARRPEFEWSPVWEYGAFIDVRDLAAAVRAALTVEGLSGHHRVVLAAEDITSASDDSMTLVGRLIPEVPIRSTQRFQDDPFASLVDSAGARDLLHWAPVHRWRPRE